MLPAGGQPSTSWVHYTTSCNTQSSAHEDGQNNCPKHVELTGIINKPLLLHLVGCLYYLYQWFTVKQISYTEIYLLIKYIKIFLLRVAKRLSCIEDVRCLKVKVVLVFTVVREFYFNIKCLYSLVFVTNFDAIASSGGQNITVGNAVCVLSSKQVSLCIRCLNTRYENRRTMTQYLVIRRLAYLSISLFVCTLRQSA